MTSERATVRPVTLGRLVEVTFLADGEPIITEDVESQLNVSYRRARETILEAQRIDLIEEIDTDGDDSEYAITNVGKSFVTAIKNEDWRRIDGILRARSPHYGALLETIEEEGPVGTDKILKLLEERSEFTHYDYNETSVDVLGDWAQRLGVIQRNAFSGVLYLVEEAKIPSKFPYELVSLADELEETAGVNLSQRYLSVPEVREELCQRLGCPRSTVDDALVMLAEQNVGRLELSGAPIDTGAKDARFGIKELSYAGDQEVVSTEGSTEQVMRGVELYDKQYYYLTIHNENLTFEP